MITVKEIAEATAEVMNISVNDIYSSRRSKDICLARWIVFFIAREFTQATSTTIGSSTNKDHTSVLYGIAKVQEGVSSGEPTILALLDAIIKYVTPDGMEKMKEVINKIQRRVTA